jgi:hypothetical protein
MEMALYCSTFHFSAFCLLIDEQTPQAWQAPDRLSSGRLARLDTGAWEFFRLPCLPLLRPDGEMDDHASVLTRSPSCAATAPQLPGSPLVFHPKSLLVKPTPSD